MLVVLVDLEYVVVTLWLFLFLYVFDNVFTVVMDRPRQGGVFDIVLLVFGGQRSVEVLFLALRVLSLADNGPVCDVVA